MEITGTAINAKTKKPLGEAKVTLSVGTTEMASLYSDGKGYFVYEESTDYIGETLTCVAEKEGFKTKTLTRTIEEQIIPLEVAMEEEAVEPVSTSKPSILPKILIGAGIGVVVLALVLVGIFVIPKFFGNGQEVEILPPEIVSFTAAPSTINRGKQSILTWKTKNAVEVIIEPIGKEFKLSGTNKVSPDKTTTYTLMARNEEGKKVKKKVTVKVKVEILPPEIVSFTASPSTINIGGRSILTWKTENAVEVIIEPLGKRVRPFGRSEVRPPKTTTYTLIARNKEGKKVRRNVTVKVLRRGVPQFKVREIDPDRVAPRRELREIDPRMMRELPQKER